MIASGQTPTEQTRREGDRCSRCGYWWWNDGKWHSLVPKLYAGIEDEARSIEWCGHCEAGKS